MASGVKVVTLGSGSLDEQYQVFYCELDDQEVSLDSCPSFMRRFLSQADTKAIVDETYKDSRRFLVAWEGERKAPSGLLLPTGDEIWFVRYGWASDWQGSLFGSVDRLLDERNQHVLLVSVWPKHTS